MSSLKRSWARTGNRIGVWLYRTLDGRLASGSKDVHVLLITTPGRRTGLPRSTCVRYLDVEEGLVVWGTGAGSPRDPDWFRNLRLASVADVQVGAKRMRARPCELVGAERDAMWNDVVLAQAPAVAKYVRRASRVIPVAVLEPIATRCCVQRNRHPLWPRHRGVRVPLITRTSTGASSAEGPRAPGARQ